MDLHRPSPRVVAASVAAAAVEAAIEYEAIAAASQAAAQSSWQTAFDWIDVADAVKASPKPSPFDSKLSPFDAESNND